MVGAELSHIEIQFNHETCDGRSTRSRRFFPLSLVCSSSSFIFFVLYQEMRCYLRMNTAESLCIGKIFSTSCCRIGLCPNRKFKSLTLQTIFFEKENQLKNLRQKIYVKNFLLPNLIHCLWQCKRVVQDICFSYGVCIQYFLL